MSLSERAPDVSVIVVSDYAGGDVKSWDDLRACLDALAGQDYAGAAEFVVCEWEGFRDAVPADLAPRLPGVRFQFVAERTAYELKNEAVSAARAPIVAMLDADCIPVRGWLRALMDTFRDHPQAAAVSGRSLYQGRTRVERVLALLTRSVEDTGVAARSQRISTNNSAFRRDAYLRRPLTLEAGSWGARLQSEAMLRDGAELRFEPGMQVVHDHTGWPMERDIRRNIGRCLVTTRRVDPLQPWAWVVRLGYLSIPIFVLGQTVLGIERSLRLHRHYGLAWYDLPLIGVLALVTHGMEVPGIVSALRGEPVGATEYR